MKHQEPHQVQEFGMRHQLIMRQLLVVIHQLKKNQRDATVGTKRPKQNVKLPVIILVGWKHHVLTEVLVKA